MTTPWRPLRTRMLAGIWAAARGRGQDSDWVHQVASAVVGRTLVEQFGLSTCTDEELGRVLTRIRRELGLADAERSGRGRRRSGQRPTPGVIPIASVATLRLIEGLREQLHLSAEELAGITRQATRGRTARARTAHEARLVIEALFAIRGRRARAAGGGGPHPSDRSDRAAAQEERHG